MKTTEKGKTVSASDPARMLKIDVSEPPVKLTLKSRMPMLLSASRRSAQCGLPAGGAIQG